MTSTYDLLIFDWDGTLMDSVNRITQCARNSFDVLKLPVPSIEAVKKRIGMSLALFMEGLLTDPTESMVSELCETYRQQWFLVDMPPVAPFSGVFEMLEGLQRRGFDMVVATGKSRNGLKRDMPGSGLATFFSATRCADESGSKPDPAMVHWLCNHRGTPPERALIIGDASHDLEMAQRAGIDSVGVLCGCQTEAELKIYNPLAVFNQTSELLNWL